MNKRQLISLLILLLGFSKIQAKSINGVTVTQNQNNIIIENNLIAINYNLAKGTYSAIDKVKNIETVATSFSQVNNFLSNEKGALHTFKTEAVKDKLGKGAAILIISKKKNYPDQLLKIKLFENQNFVVMQSGIRNTLSKPYILKRFSPLVNAAVFRNLNLSENF